MRLAAQAQRKRNGATAVEMAVVISIFAMMMFGILEYCLIIYTYQVVENAAREGARYAVVNVTDSTMITDTQGVVKNFMCGVDAKNTKYNCDVYLADAAGTKITSRPATEAQFGEYVCVDVTLDYVPITPGLLYLKTFTVRSRSSMGSEAN